MFEQLAELEKIAMKLEQMTSIFSVMYQVFFKEDEPDDIQVVECTDCINVIDALRDMITSQRDDLEDTIKKLYSVGWELRKLSDQNIALLKGGVPNG